MISTSTGKETKNPAISIDQSSDAQFTRLANSVGRGAGGAAAGNYTTGATLLEPATWVDKGFRGLAHLLGFKLDGPGPAEMLQQGARESAASISEDVQADKQREVQQYGSIPLVERVAETGATVALDMGVKYKLASKAISLAGGTPTQSSVMALIGGIDNADKGAVETALGMAGGAVRGKVAAVTQDYGPGVQCGGAGRRGRCLHLRSDGRRGAGRD
jgi:hypothetical protein